VSGLLVGLLVTAGFILGVRVGFALAHRYTPRGGKGRKQA
jgi:hypothetical protein